MTTSFHPPRRILLGPGPSDVGPRVLAAMARPTIGHLDPRFVEMMDELRGLLQSAFRTKNRLTLPVSAPGSAGMEATFANLVEPGDQVVIGINGVFGGRMAENVERMGGRAVRVEHDWGRPVDPGRIEDALKEHPDARLVAVVHAETSTGARSDVATIASVAHEHDALILVDAVTSLGGIELDVDGWELDAVYSGSQKCLSCTPGLSPVTFSEAAVDRIRGRKTKIQSWFLDMNLVMGYWGDGSTGASRSYHHTAPVNALYGLHEALVILHEEGLEAAIQRHLRHHRALAAGLEVLGLQFLVDAEHRLPQLNAVHLPEGVDDAAIRRRLLELHGLEIGAGLGAFAGKAWRIGLMGHSSTPANVLACLAALASLLGTDGDPVAAALAVLDG